MREREAARRGRELMRTPIIRTSEWGNLMDQTDCLIGAKFHELDHVWTVIRLAPSRALEKARLDHACLPLSDTN